MNHVHPVVNAKPPHAVSGDTALSDSFDVMYFTPSQRAPNTQGKQSGGNAVDVSETRLNTIQTLFIARDRPLVRTALIAYSIPLTESVE